MGFLKKSSLMGKLMLAFIGVSLLGIAIMGLSAVIASRIELYRFLNEISYKELVDDLATYQLANGTFSGAEVLLDTPNTNNSGFKHEFFVVDTNGTILISSNEAPQPSLPTSNITRMGLPIKTNGTIVAYLIPLRPPAQPYGDIRANLRRVNNNLWIGVIAAVLMALMIGFIISRKILQPIKRLNNATQLVAAGDLEHTVDVNSNDEIGQLAEAFNQMTNSLRKDRDLRRQMIADIAHELRNPLTIIMGNAEAISEGILPPSKEAMEVIYDEARHLSVLVDDLRTLSLSEAGELNLQKSLVTLADIFERVSLNFALKLSQKKATLVIKPTNGIPQLMVDADRLTQVLNNLLTNSLKHIDSGGRVVVSASFNASQGNKDSVVITVEDNGAGIAAEDLPFVFDRFYRARNTNNRLLDGTGLGLAISRSLVQNHGGEMSVSSDPGKSTIFTIFLPVV